MSNHGSMLPLFELLKQTPNLIKMTHIKSNLKFHSSKVLYQKLIEINEFTSRYHFL